MTEELNPLEMYELEPGGPYVLPEVLCSRRRAEFMTRGNDIVGFYYAIAFYAEMGRQAIEQQEANKNFKYDTPIRTSVDGESMTLNYGLLKKTQAKSGAQLTSQVFAMVYGNFEAFLADQTLDALRDLGISDPETEAVGLMTTHRWPGKISRIAQKFDVKLGKRKLVNHFRDFEMEFLGEKFDDPIAFLDRVADFRHRIVHSAGRVDSILAAMYPGLPQKENDVLKLPFVLPIGLHRFFVMLTEIFDEAFASKFGWERKLIKPETLT